MAKISWTKWSVKDLRAIYQYISLDSSFYASRVIDKLIERVNHLASYPDAGRIVPEKDDPSIRELIEGNYRIFYRIHKGNITILRVHHSARKVK